MTTFNMDIETFNLDMETPNRKADATFPPFVPSYKRKRPRIERHLFIASFKSYECYYDNATRMRPFA
ncbi:hypothetical protein JTE90_015006 [Oedothorax gibbosus]|uniref:Uncharacterized protein n=1 Tax=Oedothorax gibbosus TaxID=931172 RepID=A0AAV6TUY2_9ARAC|nr:hypothetical protein JTE90_015006 [Oedothorax gibbosus]